MALALFLARLLGSSRSSVPHSLPPVLCGSSTGPGLSRASSLRHSLLTTWSLVLGPGFRVRSPAPPPPFHGMSRLAVRVCLHILKCCLHYFLVILDDISSESLVPS